MAQKVKLALQVLQVKTVLQEQLVQMDIKVLLVY
jgi:hypothetical protein